MLCFSMGYVADLIFIHVPLRSSRELPYLFNRKYFFAFYKIYMDTYVKIENVLLLHSTWILCVFVW